MDHCRRQSHRPRRRRRRSISVSLTSGAIALRRMRVVNNGGGDRLGRWGSRLSKDWRGRVVVGRATRPRAGLSATTGARGRRPGSRRRRGPRGPGREGPCRRLTACANWRWQAAWARSPGPQLSTSSCRRDRRAGSLRPSHALGDPMRSTGGPGHVRYRLDCRQRVEARRLRLVTRSRHLRWVSTLWYGIVTETPPFVLACDSYGMASSARDFSCSSVNFSPYSSSAGATCLKSAAASLMMTLR